MSQLIEDKERHKAWVQYIKRPIPPTLDSAFDWAWLRQQGNIEKLQAENTELQRKLDLAVEALSGLIFHCVDFNQGEGSFVLAIEIEKADKTLKEIGEER